MRFNQIKDSGGFRGGGVPTRRVRPNRIPVVCFEIVGLFDHESPLVVTPMCGSRGGGQGVRTPLENHKNIGVLSNTGLDPLKNHKATKPAFNAGHHCVG